jgi:hypothetical protein
MLIDPSKSDVAIGYNVNPSNNPSEDRSSIKTE